MARAKKDTKADGLSKEQKVSLLKKKLVELETENPDIDTGDVRAALAKVIKSTEEQRNKLAALERTVEALRRGDDDEDDNEADESGSDSEGDFFEGLFGDDDESDGKGKPANA